MPSEFKQLSIADQYAVANELVLLLVELEAIQIGNVVPKQLTTASAASGNDRCAATDIKVLS